MQTLTETIDGMDRSVALMPVIRDEMDAIGGQVDHMSRDMVGLRGTTARMDGRMDALNAGVFDMSQRFRGLNGSVAWSRAVDLASAHGVTKVARCHPKRLSAPRTAGTRRLVLASPCALAEQLASMLGSP